MDYNNVFDTNAPPPEPSERESESYFNHCSKVDLHATGPIIDIGKIVSIAAEHSFRGIVTDSTNLVEIAKEINRPNYGDKAILPICLIDHPFGNSSIAVRIFSIYDAKEKGAREIEIFAPKNKLETKDFKGIHEDIMSINSACERVGIAYKYVYPAEDNDEQSKTRICRSLSVAKTEFITTISEFDYKNRQVDNSDSIIRMRNIKNKTNSKVKAFLHSGDISTVTAFFKAGVDIIGLPWQKAPNLIHGYEYLLNNDAQNTEQDPPLEQAS